MRSDTLRARLKKDLEDLLKRKVVVEFCNLGRSHEVEVIPDDPEYLGPELIFRGDYPFAKLCEAAYATVAFLEDIKLKE